jgi:hypothetical protein
MQLYTYFIGYVEAMDEIGVLIKQASTGLMSFFFWEHVISISEEEVEIVKPDKIVILNETPVVSDEDFTASSGDKINVDALNDLAKRAKSTFVKKQ